jgi:hypothetical protein
LKLKIESEKEVREMNNGHSAKKFVVLVGMYVHSSPSQLRVMEGKNGGKRKINERELNAK